MHLPRFTLLRPRSREDAVGLLARHGPAARLVAGGTDLWPRLKYGLARPEVVVSLKRIAPAPPGIGEGDRLELDALTSLADLVRSPEVGARAPILAQAALSVASTQIRNQATLGGNLCLEARCEYYNQSHTFQFVEPCLKRGGDSCYFAPKGRKCWAVFAADTAPALLALGASVELLGPAGTRQIPLEGLYSGDGACPLALGAGELVARVLIPPGGPGRRAAYRKFSRRKGLEFAGLTVAVVLEVAEGTVCTGGRIAVGSVGDAPVRAARAEESLRGLDLADEEALRDTARAVAGELRPIAHHGYGAGHLRACLEVEARRALAQALQEETSLP
ncbi:MAG: FAD binding domain-containing protein [Deferrisomatales bacterium]